jgi:hypothetical protein
MFQFGIMFLNMNLKRSNRGFIYQINGFINQIKVAFTVVLHRMFIKITCTYNSFFRKKVVLTRTKPGGKISAGEGGLELGGGGISGKI